MEFNPDTLRKDFPILHEHVNNLPLIYLDNAATSQKPKAVIHAISDYYDHYNANVHRGIHALSERATDAYEQARMAVKKFLGVGSAHNCVFVRNTTEAINLVAQSFGEAFVNKGDEIIISEMEHHSNIVPWQLMCEKRGAILKIAPINDDGDINLDTFKALLSSKTKLVAITHISNVLGTINPIEEITRLSHAAGAKVLIDGAQAPAHIPVDISKIDCDFYTISGHKMLAPMGIGALIAKSDLLNNMPPYQGGGSMIERVTFKKTTFCKAPARFEAGTPNVAGAIGLHAAVDYLSKIDYPAMIEYEESLIQYAREQLQQLPKMRILGNPKVHASVLSFTFEDIHPHDLATIVDQAGVAVRAGHHCAQPLMDRYQVPATLRASVCMYNKKSDIDALIAGLLKARSIFDA